MATALFSGILRAWTDARVQNSENSRCLGAEKLAEVESFSRRSLSNVDRLTPIHTNDCFRQGLADHQVVIDYSLHKLGQRHRLFIVRCLFPFVAEGYGVIEVCKIGYAYQRLGLESRRKPYEPSVKPASDPQERSRCKRRYGCTKT